MRSALGAMGLLILCTACVSTNAAVLNPSLSYQKICPDGVEMFTSADRVPGPYHEVAILNSKGESSWTDENQMMRSQQKKAASLGANGIILGDTKEPNAGTKIIGSLLGTGAERKGKAIAIFIPSDSTRVQRVCGTTPHALGRPSRNGDEVPAATLTPFGLTPAPTVPGAVSPPEPAGSRTAPVGPPERHSVWFNGRLGYGSIGCAGCDGRFGGLSPGSEYLVRLRDDPPFTFIMVAKGRPDPLEQVKAQAAQRWVDAVNAEGSFGRWGYAIVRDPSRTVETLEASAAEQA